MEKDSENESPSKTCIIYVWKIYFSHIRQYIYVLQISRYITEI